MNSIAAPVARPPTDQVRQPDGLTATDSRDAQAGLLGRVVPNSRSHWALLILVLAGGIAFNLTWFIDGLLRPGYDPLVQPMSALSLGRADGCRSRTSLFSAQSDVCRRLPGAQRSAQASAPPGTPGWQSSLA